MNPPDWQNCTEEILWKYVAWHLEGSGIQSVLVGGAVVSIYTEGLYRSGDLDLIPDDTGRPRLEKVLAKNWFQSDQVTIFQTPRVSASLFRISARTSRNRRTISSHPR